VGKVLDTKLPPKSSPLLKYIGKSIVINKTVLKIHRIEPVIGGIKVKVANRDGQVMGITSEFGSEVIDIKRFEDWMVENQKA